MTASSSIERQNIPTNPEQIVNWYRSLEPEELLDYQAIDLAQAAEKILDVFPDGYFRNDAEQPYKMDAACIWLEASRHESGARDRHEYRENARQALISLAKNEDSVPSVVIDSLMYYSDSLFMDLHERYQDEEIGYGEFSDEWLHLFKRTQESMVMEIDQLQHEDRGKYLGKLFEWFWLQDRRKMQMESEEMDDYLVRAAYTREDRRQNQGTDLSDNIDIAVEEINDGAWSVSERYQLGLGLNKLNKRYKPGIKVRMYQLAGNPNGMLRNLKKWAEASLAKAEEILNADFIPNPRHKESWKEEEEFIDSYIPG